MQRRLPELMGENRTETELQREVTSSLNNAKGLREKIYRVTIRDCNETELLNKLFLR